MGRLDSGHLLAYSCRMTASVNSLFSAALELPDETRLQLVERLIPTIQSEPALEDEQITEVQRRIRAVQSGQVKTVAGEQVFQSIEQSLAARRNA